MRSRTVRRRRHFTIGLLFGVALMVGYQTYQADRASHVPDMPKDEAAFVDVAVQARQAWVDAPNDLARVDMRAGRAAALCQTDQALTAANWTGRVQNISPDGFPDYFGRKTARIVITLAPHLALSTPAAPLLNNPATMVEAGSRIYATAATLRPGTLVIFSAIFFANGDDCMDETSLTPAGAMTDPVFKIQLMALQARK